MVGYIAPYNGWVAPYNGWVAPFNGWVAPYSGWGNGWVAPYNVCWVHPCGVPSVMNVWAQACSTVARLLSVLASCDWYHYLLPALPHRYRYQYDNQNGLMK